MPNSRFLPTELWARPHERAIAQLKVCSIRSRQPSAQLDRKAREQATPASKAGSSAIASSSSNASLDLGTLPPRQRYLEQPCRAWRWVIGLDGATFRLRDREPRSGKQTIFAKSEAIASVSLHLVHQLSPPGPRISLRLTVGIETN